GPRRSRGPDLPKAPGSGGSWMRGSFADAVLALADEVRSHHVAQFVAAQACIEAERELRKCGFEGHIPAIDDAGAFELVAGGVAREIDAAGCALSDRDDRDPRTDLFQHLCHTGPRHWCIAGAVAFEDQAVRPTADRGPQIIGRDTRHEAEGDRARGGGPSRSSQ